jgi:hypothetical protein
MRLAKLTLFLIAITLAALPQKIICASSTTVIDSADFAAWKEEKEKEWQQKNITSFPQ